MVVCCPHGGRRAPWAPCATLCQPSRAQDSPKPSDPATVPAKPTQPHLKKPPLPTHGGLLTLQKPRCLITIAYMHTYIHTYVRTHIQTYNNHKRTYTHNVIIGILYTSVGSKHRRFLVGACPCCVDVYILRSYEYLGYFGLYWHASMHTHIEIHSEMHTYIYTYMLNFRSMTHI